MTHKQSVAGEQNGSIHETEVLSHETVTLPVYFAAHEFLCVLYSPHPALVFNAKWQCNTNHDMVLSMSTFLMNVESKRMQIRNGHVLCICVVQPDITYKALIFHLPWV